MSGPEHHPPKLKVGDIIGGQTILEYDGYYHKDNLENHHWYLARCRCGAERLWRQRELKRRESKRRKRCSKCMDRSPSSMLTFLEKKKLQSDKYEELRWAIKTWPVP